MPLETRAGTQAEVLAHLRQLHERGSHSLVTHLVESLLSESADKLAIIQEALSCGDGDTVYRAAHTLQGSAAMAGAETVSRACGELARKARVGSVEGSDPAIAEIAAGFDAIRQAMAQWSEQSAATSVDVPPAVSARTKTGKRILVIDDDEGLRRITQMLVEGLGHDVETARDGSEGLAKLKLGIDLILLDVVMPGLDGFDVCRSIRHDPHGKDVPVIMVTTLETKEHRLRAVEAGANDFIPKPVDETELRVRSASLLKMKEAQDELRIYQSHLENMVEERTASLRIALGQMAEARHMAYQAQLETVERLAILAEYKDKVTARHIQRMSEYCAIIARGLGLPPDEVELILHASRMHDVGKIAIPDAILGKRGSLDAKEWVVMRGHSMIGSAILDNSTSEILRAGQQMALYHHERWDGNGYPHGLSGNEIPLWGRICAVGDVFDAVTSERPYKPPFPNEEALDLLREGRGKHFDPRVVDAFFERLEEILAIQEQFRDR